MEASVRIQAELIGRTYLQCLQSCEVDVSEESVSCSNRLTFDNCNSRVRPEIRDATLCIDQRYSIRRHHLDPSRCSSGRIRLFRKIEI